MFKVCFIGIGSIAKRHIKNLSAIFEKEKKEIQIDAYRSGKGRSLTGNIIKRQYFNLEELPDDYDIIFITNPTEYHLETLYKLKDKGKSFFIEKPLTSIKQLDKLKKMNKVGEEICYVACPLRYMKVIQYVKNNIPVNEVYSIRCISSSFLPEWRPGQDYRETYSAHQNLGGGVEIDLIHEWDYIKYLFGMPERIQKIIRRVSDLEIDSNDIACYIGEYGDKIVEIHLDYFGREPIRIMQLFTKYDTIECDLLKSEVRYLKQRKTLSFEENRDDYQTAELYAFLNILAGNIQNENTINDAYETLLLTQGDVI